MYCSNGRSSREGRSNSCIFFLTEMQGFGQIDSVKLDGDSAVVQAAGPVIAAVQEGLKQVGGSDVIVTGTNLPEEQADVASETGSAADEVPTYGDRLFHAGAFYPRRFSSDVVVPSEHYLVECLDLAGPQLLEALKAVGCRAVLCGRNGSGKTHHLRWVASQLVSQNLLPVW